jgi:hypothetical protein
MIYNLEIFAIHNDSQYIKYNDLHRVTMLLQRIMNLGALLMIVNQSKSVVYDCK